jgi:signal transduction histidine kinase
MTIRRFAEVAWTRHGPTRYVSVALTPLLVALLAPGWWWIACAAGAGVGIVIDLRAHAAFQRLCIDLESLDDRALQAAVRRHIAALAAITAAYVLPYATLAFAPQPGPVIGLLFCAGAALICATLHVMTRTMIFYTAPTIVLGLTLNAAAMAPGLAGATLAVVAGLFGVNAIVAARAGASSFGDLIAERLKAEQAAEELEQRVRERTAQLAVATKRAQAASRAKSMFLANMSHELRTPLNAVIGYSEIVQEDLESGDTATSAGDLMRIRNAANHLLAMINEVLDFSRIEAGKLELRRSQFDLRALLHDALDAVKPTAAKNGTVCSIEIAPEIGLANTDETRLRQCVLNLLSNAAKFTHDGVIALEARRCRVGGAPGVAVAVRDTGPGIEPEQLRRLFSPFVQGDASHTRAHDGAGLGLVITRRLARAMGGDVAVTSKPGCGSLFTLYLPLTAAGETRAAA